MGNFICPNCGNKDERYVGYKNGMPYCRLCVSMRKKEEVQKAYQTGKGKIFIDYKLTEEQREIAIQVIDNFQKKINTLIYAVTGAGKTELVFGVIQNALENKLQVGFACPRREVVIELYDRLKTAFKGNSVVAVYGEHTEKLFGEIIVLTTHQLYRYTNYFDLLVLDEIDAFPFKDNDLLNQMFFRSIKGNYVMMSATPSEKVLNFFKRDGFSILTLKTRYHKNPIPVPKIKEALFFGKFLICIKLLKHYILLQKQVFVFAPTISKCEFLYKIVSFCLGGGNFVHSKREGQSRIIKDFKDKKYSYLVTTAVLERGITVKGLQVIIFEADHRIYDKYSLIQISGRAGRKIDEAFGDVIFIASKETEAMKDAIETIKECNTHL